MRIDLIESSLRRISLTSCVLQQLLEEGQGLIGWDIRSKSGVIYDSGDKKFTTSTVAKVVQATAAVLLHAEETKNQYVHVSSFTLTQNMVWEALERVSGSKFKTSKGTVAELHAAAKKHLEEGDWDRAYYEMVTVTVYSGTSVIYFPERADYWNKVLGLVQEEGLDETLKQVLKKTDVQ